MAKNNNLTDFLTNTANAIREAEGSTAAIDPQDFEAKIKALKPSASAVTRAETTISVTANDTADTLKIDAYNDQGTGYVTGANKTATTTVTLTASGATVTATETGGKKVSKSVASGSTTTPATTVSVTPTISVDSSGKITASGSATKSVTPTVSAGYVSSGTAGTITASASNTKQLDTQAGKTITPSTSEQTAVAAGKYTTGDVKVAAVPSGAISASGTASATTTVAPGTVTIANKTASVSGKTQIAAAPTTATSGISTYYMAVDATAAANSTGATSNISGTATAKVDTAGYVSSDVTGSVTGTATAKTSAKSSSTYYIPVASGGCTVAGGGLSVNNNYSGTPTVDITLDGQTTSGVAITDTKPSSGYYLTVGANSSALSGSTKVTRAAVTDTHTAGYIPAKSATTVINSTSASPTVTVNAGSKTEYITIPSGGCTVSGGGLSGGSSVTPTVSISSGSDTNMSNVTVGSKDTTNYPYYFKVNGSSSSGSSTVSRAAIKDTHTAGYIPAKSATTVISSDSKTVNVNSGSGSSYVGLKGASLSASGTVAAAATVTPGKLSIDTLTADEHTAAYGRYSGTGTLITPSIVDDPDAITFPYVIALKPEVAEGSASIFGSGTATASVSSAGYAPTSLTAGGSVSVSGTAKSSKKTGDPYYITLWGATPNQNASLSLVNAGSTALDVDVTIPQDGYIKAGTKYLSADLKDLPGGENLMASNIKKDVYMLGFTGTYEGEIGTGGNRNFIPYSPKLTRESSDYAGGTVTYRFQETDDGYWESSNKGVNSSFSLGRFSFEVFETCDVTFEVINYAEANYDYAIFSKLDSSYFSNNTTADSSAYKSFKGSSSSSIQELTYYSVSPGTHTIAVKFIKDTSTHNYNDSVKFRLKRPTPNSELLPQVEALEPTYQGRGADEPASKHVVNYYSGSKYIQIYRNVEKGGWVQDNTTFFGDDYIYLDKINTNNTGLKPENIVAGKTIFGVTGTGVGGEELTIQRGSSATVYIADLTAAYRTISCYVEDVSISGVTVTNVSTDNNPGYATISVSSSSSITETGLIVRYYINAVQTKFAYYKLKITG